MTGSEPKGSIGRISIKEEYSLFPTVDRGRYGVTADEMRHIKQSIKHIRGDIDWPKNLGFGFLFLVPTFLAAFIQWTPVFEDLSSDVQGKYAGVGGILAMAAGGSLLIALLCFIFQASYGSSRKVDKERALDLLELIEDRHDVPVEMREPRNDPPTGVRKWLARRPDTRKPAAPRS